MNTRTQMPLALMLACLFAAGCNGRHDANTAAQSQQKNLIAEQQRTAAQTAQTYKAMDNGALLKKLAEQSARKKEPFNSLAYRELKDRKDVSSDSIVALIHELKGGDALLPLLLLRHLDAKTYSQLPVESRAEILTSALEQSATFNTWGLPHLYLEDASKALIESGPSAYPALKRMLSETRAAPVYGSQEHMEYLRYKYRLCDYALFFLKTMQGDKNFKMPPAVADRDTMIQELSK
jgi:hypothetical protein